MPKTKQKLAEEVLLELAGPTPPTRRSRRKTSTL